MIRPGPDLLLLPALLTAVACGGERRSSEPPRFTSEATGSVLPVAVLHSARDTAPGGKIAGVDVHVLLPAAITGRHARATLQHVIDSVAAADRAVAGIRVVGFLVGEYDPASGEADVVPAIVGVWAPRDTVGFTQRTPITDFRTTFTVLRPLPDGDGSGEGT